MAQKIQILLIDDTDGGQAQETVTFGLDGVTYEIDLSFANGEKLRELFADYVKAARRIGGRNVGRHVQRPKTKSADSGNEAAKIRAWAKENGYEVNARGRITRSILEAYNGRPIPHQDEEDPGAPEHRQRSEAAHAQRTEGRGRTPEEEKKWQRRTVGGELVEGKPDDWKIAQLKEKHVSLYLSKTDGAGKLLKGSGPSRATLVNLGVIEVRDGVEYLTAFGRKAVEVRTKSSS